MWSASVEIAVPRVSFPEAIRKFGVPYYIKIDIEGADGLVLDGLLACGQMPPLLSIEGDKSGYAEAIAQVEHIASLGYTKFAIAQQANIPNSIIETATLDGQTFRHEFETHSSGPFGDDLRAPWLTTREAQVALRSVALRYELFGDGAIFRLKRAAEVIYKVLSGYRGPLPGWHDIHAKL